MWVIVSQLTRVFLEDGEPRIVATLHTAFGRSDAYHFLGIPLELGSWHAIDDSCTALRAAVEHHWGALDWSGDWYVAGVVS